ncbi:MAG: IS701 family transposase [Deltaproteobacteria bacterium]|nr:IS701 family transposase [Deltaproteobacteria bacterium]
MRLVTDVPDELSACLGQYRKHFGAPAFRHFRMYVCGLVLADNLTVEGINRTFLQRKHPSSLNRFLTWSIWGQEDVNRTRLVSLKDEGEFQGKGWLVIDDTLTHKTGKFIEAVGIFKDHCEKRYVLAHNIVTSIFVRRDGTFHPLHFRLYLKEEYCKEKGIPFKTKIELAQELVEEALGLGLEIEGVLFDNWYASKEFIGFLRGRTLGWVTRLKSDRNVKIRGTYMQIRDFAATLPREAFKKVVVGKTPYWTFSKAVDLKGVGRVRIVISYDNEEFQGEPAYFATDNLQWESSRILNAYARRAKTEGFYRDAKQNLGLEAYQLRDLRGIKRHWCLVFLAYSLLVRGLWGIDGKSEDKSSPTLGERVGAATKTVFAGLVRWIVTQWNQGQSEEQICQLAFGS